MVCVLILYESDGTYSLMSTPNNRFLEKLFHGRFIYSQSFCQKSAGRKSPRKYFFFYISFWWLACVTKSKSSYKPSYCPLEYGDFNILRIKTEEFPASFFTMGFIMIWKIFRNCQSSVTIKPEFVVFLRYITTYIIDHYNPAVRITA